MHAMTLTIKKKHYIEMMMRNCRLTRDSLLVGLLLIGAMFPSFARAQSYVAKDLGTLGGPVAQAFDINELGQVVGASVQSDANFHAFLWDDTPVDISPLSFDSQSWGFALNDYDQVAIVSYDLGDLVPHGVLFESMAQTYLGHLAPRGMNNAGVIVGSSTILDPAFGWVEHPAKWVGGTLLELPTLGGHFGWAYAINDNDLIVGISHLPNNTIRRATLWINGAAVDLGTLGGTHSHAYDINAHGEVVGVADLLDGSPHAFLFELDSTGNVTERIDLGALGNDHSFAFGMNDVGQVVGTSDARAIFWQDGVMFDLNSTLNPMAGWRLDQAWEINNAGQIVGTGIHLGAPRAFLLTPGLSGDVNQDGNVGLTDFPTFVACLTGPNSNLSEECDLNDFDGDWDVDAADFVGLQLVFTGD